MYLHYTNFENDPAYQQGHELGFKIGFFIGENWVLIAGVAFLCGILFLSIRSRQKSSEFY